MSFGDSLPTPPTPPGTPENPLTLDDPAMIRALAHSARIAILQHLGLDGPATATECAEVAGLSPSACSYHLRLLARHGFIEEDHAATGDGRQRPWKAKLFSFSLTDSLAARAEVIRADYQSRKEQFPAEWRAAAGDIQDILHVTAAEAEALRAELHEVLDRYRRLDKAERSEGARRVHLMVEVVPWFSPEQTDKAGPRQETSS
jgi:DNA-binding transcriptional ArsR family regulator